MLTVCWHFPGATCGKETSLCFGQAPQIENYGAVSFYQRPQEQVSFFFSIYSIISITQMDLVAMWPREVEGVCSNDCRSPDSLQFRPQVVFLWRYFCRRLENSCHTLLSHCRFPSGDCVALRFGCSLKRFNGFRLMQTSILHVTNTWIRSRSCRFCCFFFPFSFNFFYFSDHSKKKKEKKT